MPDTPAFTLSDPPPDLLPGQQTIWKAQERFLKAYLETRSFLKAAPFANVHWRTPYYWRQQNVLNFNERLNTVCDAIADWAEEVAFTRLASPDKNRGSDLLLITVLNAYKPDRYKPALIANDPAMKETLEALRIIKRKLRDHETKANQEQGYQEAPDAIEEAQDILASRLPPRNQGSDST